jgi:hypothetical protein
MCNNENIFCFLFFRLSGVSIEFTKKHDMEESINELKNKNVDPFNGKFNFKISLNLKNFEYKILNQTLNSNVFFLI